jgi:hypothetical protein
MFPAEFCNDLLMRSHKFSIIFKSDRDILDNHLWPVLARHFADKPYRFQDDNAPVHRARLIEEFKRDNGMTWPAQSPDLNIIENMSMYSAVSKVFAKTRWRTSTTLSYYSLHH